MQLHSGTPDQQRRHSRFSAIPGRLQGKGFNSNHLFDIEDLEMAASCRDQRSVSALLASP
jgi:hypothetical protein